MKNILFKITMLYGALILFSCSKSELNKVAPTNHFNSNLESRSLTLPDITKIQGILSFDDSTDVMQAILYLEQEWDYHNDTFVDNYPLYSDDQLDSVETLLAFEEDQPLIDFEEDYSFYSLRDSLDSVLDIWLDNTTLVESTNPELFHILDPMLRTLLNTNCEIIIDSSIYTLHEDGSFTEIYDLNFSALDSLRRGVFDPESSPNGKLHARDNHNEGSSSCCVTDYDERDELENSNSTKRIDCTIELRSFPWSSSVIGKTIGFKKKSNGKWKRFKSSLTSRVHGEVEHKFPGVCFGDPRTFDKSKSKKRRRLVARYHPWLYLHVKYHEAHSVHTGNPGSLTLSMCE